MMAMEMFAGGWYWPKDKDDIDYLDDDTIQKNEFPIPIHKQKNWRKSGSWRKYG